MKERFIAGQALRPAGGSPIRSARQIKDRLAGRLFFVFTGLPLFILAALIVALALRARPLLEIQTVWELLSGRVWRPAAGQFGLYPFIAGTLWVSAVALLLAVPPCLLTAIYLVEYCRPRLRDFVKPVLDLLAGIPSVVYGVWGLIAIVPAVQKAAAWLHQGPMHLSFLTSSNPTGFSVLAGGIVLAVMIVPFIIAIICEVLEAVPSGLREASLALGATRWQTVKSTVLPITIPGIIAGVVLGAARALGETMAVLMVVGNVAAVPTSIFDPAYPLPALIANNYGEMLSIPRYDAALMGAALVLLLVILVFNVLPTLALRRVAGSKVSW
jgi:phosphate transport system permease protein